MKVQFSINGGEVIELDSIDGKINDAGREIIKSKLPERHHVAVDNILDYQVFDEESNAICFDIHKEPEHLRKMWREGETFR